MKSVWREYGVIGTLLVVAVGGYMVMSRSDVDMLNASLQTIGDHLLALVPDPGGRSDVEAALDTLRMRVAEGEVEPDKVEQFAASVFNFGAAGAELDPEEARLVVRLAYSDRNVLPATDAVAPPPPPKKPVSRRALGDLAADLEPMVAFFETIRAEPISDSAGPVFRFYSDGKLHVVADDRVREHVEKAAEAQVLLAEKAMSWRAHFAEAAEAERRRYTERAEHLVRIAESAPDSLTARHTAAALAQFNRLRSLGLVSKVWVDSVIVDVESRIESAVGDLPVAPEPADKATRGVSVSSSGSNSGR